MKCYYKISVLLSMLSPLTVQADILHPLLSIEQAAYEYVINDAQQQYDNPQVIVKSLDPRLRLKKCDSALTVFKQTAASGLGNQTVGVTCHSPTSWTVYVPIKVKVMLPVAVTRRTLPANHIISEQDITLAESDLSLLRQGYIDNIKQLIGQQLKHPLTIGSVINANNIKPQKIVHRGQQITLIAAIDNMEITMNGTALADGQLGQRVRVKNSSSKRVVEGIVAAPGLVKVAM